MVQQNWLSAVVSCPNIMVCEKVMAWTDPDGPRRLRLPDFKTMAHEGGTVVSPTHRPPSSPRKYYWYSFLLETESTPGS